MSVEIVEVGCHRTVRLLRLAHRNPAGIRKYCPVYLTEDQVYWKKYLMKRVPIQGLSIPKPQLLRRY